MNTRLAGLPPVIAPHTRLVVLGSFPGVASLQAQQYYGHPRNHFWPILSALWGVELQRMPYPARIAAMQQRRLGLWDVYAHCRREGSLDSAIQDPVLNDLASLRQRAPGLRGVAHNGGESARAMRHTAALGLPVWRLPSTSPANASWSFDRKLAAWRSAFLKPASMSSELPFTPVTLSEHDGVRYLHLDSIWVQGAMRIRAPQKVELEYVQRMLAALLWRPPEALGEGRAVQLGLGAGAITRFTCKALKLPTTVVEINPMVVDVNRLHFHLPVGDRGLEVVVADAGAWLRQATPRSATLLHVDLYDHEAAAPVLDSRDFYADCHALLDDGGVFSVNLFGRAASFAESAARIAEVFGPANVWSLRATREGNTVVIGTRGAPLPERAERLRRADTIEARFGTLGLPARKWLRLIRPYLALPA